MSLVDPTIRTLSKNIPNSYHALEDLIDQTLRMAKALKDSDVLDELWFIKKSIQQITKVIDETFKPHGFSSIEVPKQFWIERITSTELRAWARTHKLRCHRIKGRYHGTDPRAWEPSDQILYKGTHKLYAIYFRQSAMAMLFKLQFGGD